MNSDEITKLLELQRHYGLVWEKMKKGKPTGEKEDIFNWVLDGVYHKPRLKVEHIFTKVMLHWVPPDFDNPPKVLDPTAGPMIMHQLLVKGGGYQWQFGDTEPQAEGVRKMDATQLNHTFLPETIDAMSMDPPYNRDLSEERKAWVKQYRGDRNFDLQLFFEQTAFQANRVLKPKGKLIFKIGDNHRRKGDKTYSFEDWHIRARMAFTIFGFDLKDTVVFNPYYVTKRTWAPRRRIAMHRESYFMLFEKRD